jgi:hypothetical protein
VCTEFCLELSFVFFGFTKTVIVCCCVSGTGMVANLRTSHSAVFVDIGTAMLSE